MESKVYKCKLRTLSPIHIGANKEYGASEYVPSQAKLKGEVVNTIKRIDFANYYLNLEESKQEKFLANLTDRNFRLEQYDSKISKEYTRYNAINKATSRTNDISEHIKTLDKPYIPGSSIKGAIKTAIFYNLFKETDISDVDRLIFEDNRGNLKINKRNYSNFIDSFFSADRGNSAQKSIMRFIQISDSTAVNFTTIHEVLSVMARESGRMPNGTQFYARNGNTVRSFLETIDTGKILKSDFTISYDEKILRDLDLYDKKDILDISFIKEAIFNFSNDLIDYELEFADKYDVAYLTKFYNNLAKYNTKETPIIRIGAGAGLMGTSIALKVKEYDFATFEDIRRTFRRSYDFEFPKSRKVTNGRVPLSWVQLNFE